jgi:hypothetical protein
MIDYDNTMNETMIADPSLVTTNSPNIEVVKIEEQPDGGAIVTFNMDSDSLLIFAKIGILKTIKDKVDAVLNE